MCMIDGCDERVTVLHERNPAARRLHKCNECHREIALGERYTVERYISEGSASTHKTCVHCMVARRWLLAECRGFVYGYIGEDLVEHVTEGGYGMDLARLAVGLRRKWRRRDGRLQPVPAMPITTHQRAAQPDHLA